MGQVVTIGLDIAKSVFQVHGVDASGATVLRQRLTLITLRRSGRPATVGLPDSAQCSHPLPAPSATWLVP